MVEPKDLAPPETFLDLEGLSIHFVREGAGPPVVLVHGFGGWVADWRYLIPALAAEHEVFALDLPGWGLSDKPADFDYSLASQARFVLAFLDRFGLEQVDLVGHSMGGGIAIQLAVTHPERVKRLVLIDSVGYRSLLLHTWGQRLARLPFAETLVQTFLPDVGRVRLVLEWLYGNRDKLSREAVEAHFRPLQTPGMAAALVQMAKTLQLDSVKDLIPRVRQPTLILWGERDRLMPVALARRLHHEIERSRLVILPEAGHVPQEEVAEQVNPLIVAFLR